MPLPTARPITDDEFPAFVGVQRLAMLYPPPTEDDVAARRVLWPVDRCLGALDGGGRLCGVARTFATRLSTPGGDVAAAAVSSVGVLPTHRRQGHLTRLMRTQLADVADRGEPVAILVSAEWPIYGRYGYGLATEACALRVDARAAEMREPATGTVSLAEPKEFLEASQDVYARAWRRHTGHITWEDWHFEAHAGLRDLGDDRDESRRAATRVLWRDDDGVAQGVVAYQVHDSDWTDNRPAGHLTAALIAAATDEAERELLRYLVSVDWVATVGLGLRPVDDATPLRLVDGRHAVLENRFDHIWLRVVDVPGALAARSYATAGSLVVEVTDPLGLAAGRFALDASPAGATCTPTDRAADLVVPASALGAAYLGGTSWARLAAAGWVDEARPGAVDRAAALFTAPRAPWCSTGF